MNAHLRKLLDQRATAWSQVQDIRSRRSAAGYEPTTEDGETYTRALDEVERLSAEIETEQRAENMGRMFDGPADDHRSTNPRPDEGEERDADPAAAYRQAFDTFMRRGIGDLTPEQRSVLSQGFVESRALGAGTGAAGGYTVPVEQLNKMVETMKAFGGILSVADVITTTDGHPLQWPTNDDTNNIGALLSENTQVTEQDLTFASAQLGAYMYTSKMVRVSYQLLQDSAFNLDAWLPRKLGERIGRALAVHLATGTGVNQPQGLITGLTKTVTSAAGAGVSYADLVGLQFAIDPAYRNSNNLRYVLADTALRSLLTAVDPDGRPLWVPTTNDGAFDQIAGKPYTVDNNMAALALGSKSVVYGDIRAAYTVRQVQGAQTLRLTERFADFLQVAFLGFARFDAVVQDANAAAVLTQKAS
jgi:HK97 family phage major capsid protein